VGTPSSIILLLHDRDMGILVAVLARPQGGQYITRELNTPLYTLLNPKGMHSLCDSNLGASIEKKSGREKKKRGEKENRWRG
jgi:hypothetical protein